MADRKKMEGHCSKGQSPQWAVVPMEEEESSPVTGPGGPRGFQEVKVPRFRNNGTGWW